MPTYKTTGLVLKRINFGEADRVITFLTPDHGKLRAVAKGVRKIKSRMAGHLELFSETELMLAKGKNLDVIASARLKHHYQSLAENWQSLTFAYLMAEILEKVIDQGITQRRVFGLTAEILKELDERGYSPMLELSFKLRLMDLLGYRPNLEQCVVCGKETGEFYFDPKLGGIIDAGCAQGRPFAMSQPALILWRALLKGQLPDEVEELSKHSLLMCNAFMEQTLNLRFNSREMLEIGQ